MDVQLELKNNEDVKNCNIKNLKNESKNFINVFPNPLAVEKIKNIPIQHSEQNFEVDINKKILGIKNPGEKKSKNIIADMEIDLGSKEIKNNPPHLEIVDSVDSTEFIVNEKLTTEDKIFKDANMSTVPSIIRMNVNSDAGSI